MATVAFNSITKGFVGSIGGLLFRQIDGRTIVSKKPRAPRKQSEQQRANRLKFKNASYWAKTILIIPARKEYYKRMAKKLKLPNAYTAAICDYMRKGEIKEIDTRLYKGNAGDTILIKTFKKDFSIDTVRVTLRDHGGNVIEMGDAVKKNGFFIYKTSTAPSEKTPLTLRVSLPDHGMNVIAREIQIMN